MGAAYFYHLTRAPLEAVLPMLLEKSVAAGWRVMVRGTDDDRMKWLDERLWLGRDDGFLPHGLAGGEGLQQGGGIRLDCGQVGNATGGSVAGRKRGRLGHVRPGDSQTELQERSGGQSGIGPQAIAE